jgi:hypothetical protein
MMIAEVDAAIISTAIRLNLEGHFGLDLHLRLIATVSTSTLGDSRTTISTPTSPHHGPASPEDEMRMNEIPVIAASESHQSAAVLQVTGTPTVGEDDGRKTDRIAAENSRTAIPVTRVGLDQAERAELGLLSRPHLSDT